MSKASDYDGRKPEPPYLTETEIQEQAERASQVGLLERLAQLEAIERAVGWVQKNGIRVVPLPTGTWGMTVYGADRTAHSYTGETWLQAVQKAMAAMEKSR